jgi:hypothetical protein
MHNFRYISTVAYNSILYVSKAGNDSNDGLTPENAKATIGGACIAINGYSTNGARLIIIGSGTYEESFTLNTTKFGDNSRVVGDGNVVLRGNTSNAITMSLTLVTFENITIENYASVNVRNGFYNCLLKNIPNVAFGTAAPTSTIQNCIFINCILTNFIAISYCIFIDCTLSGLFRYITNTYFNGNCYLTMATDVITQFDYNNIMGYIRKYQGSVYGVHKSMADWNAENPGWNSHSINANPKFNSVARLDFSLQYDSPHINAASDNTRNIGGTIYGIPFVAQTSAEFQEINGALISVSDGTPDLILSGNDYIIAPGKIKGTLMSAPTKIAANPVEIDKMQYNGFFLFNKSLPGNTGTNKNVPDSNVFPNDNALGAGNPDRLSYEMRWTNNDIMPGSQIDWLNSGIIATGDFLRFEWNVKPVFDNAGYGNGSASFNNSGILSPVSAIWIQIRVTLTNLYSNV